jgi:organic hydroperoxide reductase OsmC/OhrA
MVLGGAWVKVLAHFREQGSVLRGTAEGHCTGSEVEMAFESGEAEETIAELIRMARQICFTESALSKEVELAHRYRLNGRAIDA